MLPFITFTTPWILTSLILLPAVWWLLRIMPPAPRTLSFPPIEILRTLHKTEQTPAKMPWWLLLLRLLILTCIIFALSGPVFNPASRVYGTGPLILIVDDGWSSARHWQKIRHTLHTLVEEAKIDQRSVMLLTTAKSYPPHTPTLLSAHKVQSMIENLSPKPWAVDRHSAVRSLQDMTFTEATYTIWLSDGLEHPGTNELATVVQRLGQVEVLVPAPEDLAYLLDSPSMSGTLIEALISRATPDSILPPLTINLMSSDGRILGQQSTSFPEGETQVRVSFSLPLELRQEIAHLQIANHNSAGTTFLLDNRWQRQHIGLVVGCQNTETQPLLKDEHYLKQALNPYATILVEELESLLSKPVSLMILADFSPLTTQQQSELEQWISDGGILIRFAGPCLAQNPDPLLPVALRTGDRTLGGVLSWSTPAQLDVFSSHTPFYGLQISQDVLVHRQILAQPSLDLDHKSWARLSDGTPLVTAEKRGQGYVVLFHTTAGPEWSDLPLSGLFVEMLRRLISLGTGTTTYTSTPLPPLKTLNAFGQIQSPIPSAQSLSLAQQNTISLNPQLPPGYYGTQEFRYALNLGPYIPSPQSLQTLPPEIIQKNFEYSTDILLSSWLLVIAIILTLIDVLIMMVLYSSENFRMRIHLLFSSLSLRKSSGVLLWVTLWLFIGSTVHAQVHAQETSSWTTSLQIHLAYIKTDDVRLNGIVDAGLTELSRIIEGRTSIEIEGVLGLDPETDVLAFFPLLYWPITPQQPFLSQQATLKVNHYLRNGGMILFDTRDHRFGSLVTGPERVALRRVTQGLSIPPIQPISDSHTLTKSFYLLSDFPGRQKGGLIWASQTQPHHNDGVSSVFIGHNDWASAWAVDSNGDGLFAMIPGGERQREMAYRFGINLMMYALTGNYKSDQVHVETILKRRNRN